MTGDEPSSSAGLYFRIFRTFNVTRHTRCHAIALANSYSYNIALAKSFPGSYLFFFYSLFRIFRLFVMHFFASRAMSQAELYAPSHCLAIFALFLFISAFFDFFLHCYFRIFTNIIISLSRSLVLSRSSHSHFRTAQPFPNTSATAQPQFACYEESVFRNFIIQLSYSGFANCSYCYISF